MKPSAKLTLVALAAAFVAGCAGGVPGKEEAMKYEASVTERAKALVPESAITAEEQQEILAKYLLNKRFEAEARSTVKIADYWLGKTVSWGGDGPIKSSFLWQRELGLATFSTSFREGDLLSGVTQQTVITFKTDDLGRPLLTPKNDGSYELHIVSSNTSMETPTGRWATEQIVTFASALTANLGAGIAGALLSDTCEGCNSGVIIGGVNAVAGATQQMDNRVKMEADVNASGSKSGPKFH